MKWVAFASFLAFGGGFVLWIDWCRNRWDLPRDDEIDPDLFHGGPERPRTGRM